MDITALQAAATTVRALSMDGVQKANSGHPGMPMGCAEIGALLYGEVLKHYNKEPKWIDRDRLVLSAGHGSMWLYSLLFLSGYGLTLDDLKQFRQLGSKTAGHPEYGFAAGIETTTGPLGAGVSNAVGMAAAEQMLGARFNTDTHTIIDHYTYALAGDGCMMEGVASEAASFAGHQKLGKLILFYDSNHISIEGSTELAFTEDVKARFDAYGWQTLEADAYDFEVIAKQVAAAKADAGRPSLIVLHSVIGKGADSLEGSHETHGAPLGDDEIRATRKKLGIPEDQDFFVDQAATAYFSARESEWKSRYEDWQKLFEEWASANPELKKELDFFMDDSVNYHDLLDLPEFAKGDKIATRAASGKVLQAISDQIENLVGGSADLAPSNKTDMKGHGDFTPENRQGRTFHFGVREHGMGGIVNGIALHGGFRPFCATFLVFADYMRPTIRLAAIMKLPVIYVYTHDSIYVGEDGPTHQPIEHIASLRIIPGVHVLRPGDAEETAVAWAMAMARKDGPTVLALTRQGLEVYEKADSDWKHSCAKGAYIVKDTEGTPDIVVAATGSEVNLALEAVKAVPEKKIRVVSVLSKELFTSQDKSYRDTILPPGVRVVAAEAGVSYGWSDIASSPEDILAIDRFGESGPAAKVAEHLGMTPDGLVKILKR